MFKKRTKRNIRERQNWEESNQDGNPSEENEGSVQVNQSEELNVGSKSDAAVTTTNKVAAGSRSLLSFEDELDGDGEEFKLKKSNESLKLARERQEEKERKKQERERKKREKERVSRLVQSIRSPLV